jgi:hypothetical protein
MKKITKNFPTLTNEEVRDCFERVNAKQGLVRERSIYTALNASSDMTVTPSDDYVGKFVQEVLRYLYVKNRLVAEGLVTQIDGIKLQQTAYKASLELYFGDRTQAFTGDNKDLTITPLERATTLYRMQREFRTDSLLGAGSSFTESYRKGALNDSIMPEQIVQFILDELMEKIPLDNERLYLMGKSRVPSMQFTAAYTGFEDKLISGANKKITVPNTAITAITNIGGFLALTVGTGLGATYEVGDLIEVRGLGNGTGNTATFLNSYIYNQKPFVEHTTENLAIQSISGDVLVTNVDITAQSITIGTPVYTSAKVYCLNASNIVEYALKLWTSIPRAVRDRGDANIWMHSYAWDKFQLTQGARLGGDYTKEQVRMIMDMNVHALSTMSPNTAIVIRPENAEVLYDDVTDETNVIIENQFVQGVRNMSYLMLLEQRTGTFVPKPTEAAILAVM